MQRYTLEEVLKYSISIDRETGTKVCSVCKRKLHWTDFKVSNSGRIDPLTGERRLKVNSQCRGCDSIKNRHYRNNGQESLEVAPVDLELAMSFPLQKEWRGIGNDEQRGTTQLFC